MGKTVSDEIFLTNGQRVNIQTSTRQEIDGEKSTFISLSTDYFRIRIIQRISLSDLMSHNTKIGLSFPSETSDLEVIETLALSLEEAIKLAKQLNKSVADQIN
jgi:hypothetical protein